MPLESLKTICIDETLIESHQRSGLIIYEPNKPDKYGFLFRTMCDCKIGMLLSFFLCEVGVNGADSIPMAEACKNLI